MITVLTFSFKKITRNWIFRSLAFSAINGHTVNAPNFIKAPLSAQAFLLPALFSKVDYIGLRNLSQ